MKPIRIAIYSGVIPSTTFIERLIEALAKHNFEVVLFGTMNRQKSYSSPNIKVVGKHGGLSGLLETLIRIVRLRFTERSHYKILKNHLNGGPFSNVVAFRKWQTHAPIVLNLPDIFHIQWAKSVGEWIYLKEKFGVKLILSLRGTHITISPHANAALAKAYCDTFPRIDAFHSVSDETAEEAFQYGAKRENTRTIYSGMDVQQGMITCRKRNEYLKLLAVGRFHWLKGYHYLLDALALLKGRNIRFKLTLISQGEMPEEILFQLHELDLNEDVVWIKSLPHDQVLEQMIQHDVLILPSVQEGIANVVLEAMAIGLPVISTNCGGIGEVIEDGVSGFLVPVRDPKALADAIERLSVISAQEIKGIQTEARTIIENKFKMENSIKVFAEMYKEVMV